MNRRSRYYLSAALLLVLLLIAVGATVKAQQPTGLTDQRGVMAQKDPSKLTVGLQQEFAAAAPGAMVKYWVILADQADTSNNIPTSQWADKGWYVYNTLRAKADSTQGPLLAQLSTMKTAGQVNEITSYWIINSIIAVGNLDSAQAIAANKAVARVQELGTYQIFDSTGTLSNEAMEVYDQARIDAVARGQWSAPFVIQHNQDEVRAPQAWALGYDGTGITVGSMDTGTRWTHEALSARYRGNVAPPDPSNIHDYNWLDGYGTFTTPTDNNGHGSHTMGTLVGTGPATPYGNIGTAKGAMWMTVRICATSSCDAQPILNGFQWTLAPYRVNGTQPNAAYRPRISSNSWGSSACNTPDWQTAVTNWVNAGIFPDFATGNSGPGAGTVGAPASYVNAWGSGNLNTSVSNWVIATSSSRGPSCFDQSIRPHAIAPGTSICSSINTADNAYSCGYTGTSMATPHIAGAVAILQQKNPNLTIAQYMYALTSTAFFSPTWGTRPNNNYGWGLIQIDEALNSIPSQGTPTPTRTGTPPTSTPTLTRTNTPSPTLTPCVVAPIEGFESGTLGTYTSTVATCVPGGCGWASVTTAAHSGTRSAFAPDLANITDQYLTTISAVNVPAGATLSFWHRWDLESGFDGAVLEFSTNGGSTWADGGAMITMNPYNGTISSSFQSPISGRQAWTGNPNGTTFVESRANLASFAGQNLLIRFRTADDNSVAATGWWVDDIAILGPCSTPVPTTPSPTRTNTPPPTNTVGPTNTPPAVTNTPTAGAATATPCPMQFNDVPVGSTFYDFVRCLACRGIVGGYPCGGPGEPCPGNYFRPNNNVTRGQVSKIVSESAGFSEAVPSTQQTFEDVPPSGTFWLWVERLSGRGIIGGYACGGPFEPCVGPGNRPYFRPNNQVTRGQLSKIVAGAAGWTETPTGQTFEDVLPGSTFYVYVERVASRGIVNGYPCGGVGEPCVAPGNRPYFRTNNQATRGQMSKIAASAFFPGCSTPAGQKR